METSNVLSGWTEHEYGRSRDGVQACKVALGERGTPWWEQSDDERRERWEQALTELDALDD